MNFLKTLIASTLGVFLAFIIIGILCVILVVTVASSTGDTEPYVSDNTVLKMDFSGSLPAHSSANPFNKLFNHGKSNAVSLQTLKQNLIKAASDDNIKGVLLKIDFMNEGWANLQEAHQTITQFRDTTNKFIYATTSDAGMNEKGYYLTTAADSVFSPPESFFEFDGFYSKVTFYDGLFDKFGIKTEITRHGKYKGAVEPYFRKDLSKENKYQLKQILNGVSNEFLTAVSSKTGKSISELNAMLNKAPHLNASFGYHQGFIDSLLYANQLDSLINHRMGITDDDTYNSIDNSDYAKVSNKSANVEEPDADGDIAIIYASGPIVQGVSTNNPLASQQLITAPWFKKQLEDVTDDDDTKALVIRVNSPGGSGSTSDAIWNMIRETRKKIPVIVSMGPVAASGGYYFSMAADSIVAEPTTITGSIGVFGTKFNTKQFFNDELGITFDEVKSNNHADWLSQTRSFTPGEQKAFQTYIDGFYDTFITKVAEARNLSKQQVDSIAQGRVWIGADAKKQHLIDVLGGLDKALQIAAEKAGLTAFGTESYPKQKDLYQMLMRAAETKAQAMIGASVFGSEQVQKVNQHLSILKKRDAMLLFPYNISIE